MTIKTFIRKRKEQRKESKAFGSIIKRRALQAKRQAFEKESLKVAEEEGKAQARRPSFSKRFGEGTKKVTKKVFVASPRKTPVRRRTPRRRRLPPLRQAPRRRRRVARRVQPRQSVSQENIPSPPPANPRPVSVGDFI